MHYQEHPVRLRCNDAWLYGILDRPALPLHRGVLIVVGGPQYRVGSHRQFTLLARHLAACGIPTMRFDYRGMGDSEGSSTTFADIEDDVRAAADQFFQEMPALTELVIWGLCDAATAALLYAWKDPRVTGLILLNPWLHVPGGEATTLLKHYYLARLFSKAFWRKIGRRELNVARAMQSFGQVLGMAIGRANRASADAEALTAPSAARPLSLPDQAYSALSQFQGRVLIVTSGKDFTAQEFLDLVRRSRPWQRLLRSETMQRQHLAAADHTFSRRVWRDQVADWSSNWLRSW